jgi:glycerol-3-phosphate cytidylyltransferase-like family protein
MKQVVVMPGGFHPFHAGHAALYQSAKKAFPGADVYVAATNDTSTRPFPFAIKEKLARLAGVEPGHFVQVKSPFQAAEITQKFNPEDTQLIFVRSDKDANKPPQAGGVKKNGEPAYLQPYNKNSTAPMNQHGYMTYLPTVEFGPGMTSATEIRTAWPKLNEKRRTALVMSLYPATQKNPKLAANVVQMLDTAIGTEVAENQGWAATYEADGLTAGTGVTGGMHATYQDRYNQPIDENYLEEDRVDPVTSAAIDFYQNQVGDVNTKPVKDYREIAKKLLGQTDDPSMRKKVMDILVQGNKNPYIQGGVITTVGALLAGGILSSASRMGLTPQQTNILLQSVLNTVIPTMVSRVNGKSWRDTVKYTLASAGIGTGIAAMTETGRKK